MRTKQEGRGDKKRKNDRPAHPPRQQNRSRPQFLVSGESKFFATNSIRRSATNAMDNAFLLSHQTET